MDNTTTIQELQNAVIEFRDRRNWKQFHDIKNLSMGLSVEAAELQELFLWKTPEEITAMLGAERERKKIEEELADVFVFLLYLGDAAGIDLSAAVRAKLLVNDAKYPVEKSFNSSKKYTEF
ncbi:MAG TPA: nucleotide pyrophosphohydrolase [Spirochaetota bacterium]|nr:nucleotide pyrophosphohydrolase [Spirochaetota bacterium]HPC40276.1 nucleotide pyrophosphohydrolase [Spirochaetota bacterium]HPL15319.1 nucleotide pyrophosphohydrolase [Spirochaetota bacterium]HQF07249.1 nucleotide pyrophosphohydrolase [Spirochaetota bacterium]HQH96150.1 nucleotide pyrophosphohydrolase [Spirochaetota bacterium]